MKTLIVSCCPRGETSRTRSLVNAFVKGIPDGMVEELDLCADMPDFLTPAHIAAYQKRNYQGEELTPEEANVMAGMDRMTEQLLSADVLVLAWPMYNFSMPAMAKAWFDAILQRGKTWDMGANGYFGLLRGKKAALITTSGGVYEGEMKEWDYSVPYVRRLTAFMGMDTLRVINAAGVNMAPDVAEAAMQKAQDKITTVLSEFYTPDPSF